MKHIIAYSDGLGSFAAAYRVVSEHGPKSVECVFTDTKTEDEDLYRFLDDSIEFLGCDLVKLEDGRNIWQVFKDSRFMGNSRVDPCSKILKREMFEKYLRTYDPADVVVYYGIGPHEAHRAATIIDRWRPYQVEMPLLDQPMNKEEILVLLDNLGIQPPRLYDLGFEHNNCGGFCVKTGQRQMLHLLRTMPDRYAWHEQQQEELFADIGPHEFIRKVVDGHLHYLSLKEFREMIESGERPQMFANGACACFA